MKKVNGNQIIYPKVKDNLTEKTTQSNNNTPHQRSGGDNSAVKGKGGPKGFTIIQDGLFNGSMNAIQVLIIAHLLRQCNIQQSNIVQVSNSEIEKYTCAERTTIYRYSKELIEKGYFTKTVVPSDSGTVNQYEVNVQRIEDDFGFKV